MPNRAVELTWRVRGLWGALGGIVAVGSKFLAQNFYWVRVFMDTHAYDRLPGLTVSYISLLVVLCVIGGVFAVASEENHKMKLLAIAVAAPAIITTWLGGSGPPGLVRALQGWNLFFTPALAQQDWEGSGLSPFWKGFWTPFGYGKDEQRYRVIAGSFQSRADAEQKVAEIKKLGIPNAFVGNPMPGNAYFPVVVSEYLPFTVAVKIKTQVNKLLDIDDAYLSPFPSH
jgi:hypothetical protein